jgi:thiol-disulfide isomerase/thioredoxin
MGRRAIALAALGAVALLGATDAASVSLTDANFDKEVFDSGKNAFVKFQAPWCDPVIRTSRIAFGRTRMRDAR